MATAERVKPRFKQRYDDEIRTRLASELGLNIMAVPTVEKIVVNMGVGEASKEAKVLDEAVAELTTITGQKPLVTKAKKSIAAFKIREGMSIGAKVTLRGDRMWEFLDRLLSVALPRIRDFRGLPAGGFDGRGNYTFGVTEQLIFPEIEYDKIGKIRGMNITVVTTARNDDAGRALLSAFGFPFQRPEERENMAKKALINKANQPQKYKVREYFRCRRCGRPRAYLRKFGMCRLCVRQLAHRGELPGITKSSW